MATYFMFGKYSAEGMKGISAERTEKAAALVKKYGGEHDLVLIVELPGTEQAIKTSVALAKLTGISFSTAPAVSIEEFDKMMEEV